MAKIMVVDDDDGILNLLERFLVRLGYEVITATNGEEALKNMGERPAIVLLDIMMPGMHGFKVLDKIKETAPSTEVIVITGLDETVVGIESLERGAFEFVAKPINLEHLKFLLEFKLGQMGITE
jgi:DNA-binding response OmpR family regulator